MALLETELSILISNRDKARIDNDAYGTYHEFDKPLLDTLLPHRFGTIERVDLFRESGTPLGWDYELFAVRKI